LHQALRSRTRGAGVLGLCLGHLALVEDEQELGAACIDMGGGSTGLSIFIKKHMIYADSVRLGGDHVTSDISKGLQVPWPPPSGSRPSTAAWWPPAWTTAR
jgi:hypothetical protein